MSAQLSQCRSCGASIVWAITSSGKAMPVDAAPSENGTLVLTLVGGEQHVRVVPSDDPRPRFRAHFATCPDAESWRHRTKGGTAP